MIMPSRTNLRCAHIVEEIRYSPKKIERIMRHFVQYPASADICIRSVLISTTFLPTVSTVFKLYKSPLFLTVVIITFCFGLQRPVASNPVSRETQAMAKMRTK